MQSEHNYQTAGVFYPNATFYLEDDTIVFPGDSVYVSNSCGNISGIVYSDLNNNCSFDSLSEEPMFNNLYAICRVNGSEFYCPIDSNGKYFFSLPDNANYTVSLLGTDAQGKFSWYYKGLKSCVPSWITAGPKAHLDFGLYCNSAAQDLGIYAYSCSRFRPGQEAWVNLIATNRSCSEKGGTANFKIQPGETFLYSNPAPSRQTGNLLEWDFPPLKAMENAISYIRVKLDTTFKNGDLICHPANVTPVSGDIEPENNSSNSCNLVTTSYDPNDFTSFLAKGKEVNNLEKTEEDLLYRIRFQNTGNDTAFNIYILDTLDKNLEMESFRVVTSSHPMKTYIGRDRQIRFQFSNILLPYKKVDESGSQGEVWYAVSRKKGLPVGTKINNTGYIYFDYNEAVITNTKVNTIVGPESVQDLVQANESFTVFPNPASNQITVKLKDGGTTASMILRDITGNILLSQQCTDLTTIDATGLSAGLYLITVSTENGNSTLKVMVKK